MATGIFKCFHCAARKRKTAAKAEMHRGSPRKPLVTAGKRNERFCDETQIDFTDNFANSSL